MRRFTLLTLSLVVTLALSAPGHTGFPPTLPGLDETAPASIAASATNCDVSGTSWCAFGVVASLGCRKNGTPVVLSFNSVSSNWPHPYHLDKTWNVNLTTLNLHSGDSLVWLFSAYATSGPDKNTPVTITRTTQVQ